MVKIATNKVVPLALDFAKTIVVPRWKDDKDNGFQRDLREVKVTGVLEHVRRGIPVPAIQLAKVGDAYYCMDGQHRLEAYKRSPFPLNAEIYEMSMKRAAEAFVEIGSAFSKISRRHRIMVDPGKYATTVRGLSKRFKCEVTQVENLLHGITGGRSQMKYAVTHEEWNFAKDVLSLWTKDKRWQKRLKYRGNWKSRKGGNIYSSPSVLRMVGSLCKDRFTNIPQFVHDIRCKIDFGNTAYLAKRAGSSNTHQKEMKYYVLTTLNKEQKKNRVVSRGRLITA